MVSHASSGVGPLCASTRLLSPCASPCTSTVTRSAFTEAGLDGHEARAVPSAEPHDRVLLGVLVERLEAVRPVVDRAVADPDADSHHGRAEHEDHEQQHAEDAEQPARPRAGARAAGAFAVPRSIDGSSTSLSTRRPSHVNPPHLGQVRADAWFVCSEAPESAHEPLPFAPQ